MDGFATDWREVMARDDVHIVDVCVPGWLHAEIAIAALEAGARQSIGDGRLGTVREIRASYLQDWLADSVTPVTWPLRKETAGSGALDDIASHATDQVQYLAGDSVTEASGRLLRWRCRVWRSGGRISFGSGLRHEGFPRVRS